MQRQAVSHRNKKCRPKPSCSPSSSSSSCDAEPQCKPCVIQVAPIPLDERCSADRSDCRFIGCNPSDVEISKAFGIPNAGECTISHRDSAIKTINECYREQTRMWIATNRCNQKTTLSRTVRWRLDTSEPTVQEQYEDKSVPCGSNLDELFDEPIFADGCDADLEITYRDVKKCNAPRRGYYTVTRTWTATDECQNQTTASQTITVGPCRPEIICPSDLFFEDCNYVPTADNFDLLTANDVSGFADPFEELDIDYSEIIAMEDEFNMLYKRTITVVDTCGNKEICVQEITVPLCDTEPERFKGCLREFWAETDTQRWDSLNDYIVSRMPAGYEFTTSTIFTDYYQLPLEFGGLPADSTMLQVVNRGPTNPARSACDALLTQAVSALLSAAAFGDEYRYPPGVTDFVGLYDLIRSTLIAGVQGSCDDDLGTCTDNSCAELEQFLSESSTYNYENVCEELPMEDFNGCPSNFWASAAGITLWDSLTGPVMSNLPEELRFIIGSPFWTYFDVPVGSFGQASNLNMLFALQIGGSDCADLAKQGVAALLNIAAFGDDYRFPAEAPDFTSLKILIGATLRGESSIDCESLAEFLAESNQISSGLTCENLLAPQNFACSRSFWLDNQNLWDSFQDPVIAAMTDLITYDRRFGPNTNFWTYFNLGQPFEGFSPDLTMLGALNLISFDPCSELLGEAVASILNGAAFPTTYDFPRNTTDFPRLYEFLADELADTSIHECPAFLAELQAANNANQSQCQTLQRNIPAMKKSIAKPTKRTFIPANAQ